MTFFYSAVRIMCTVYEDITTSVSQTFSSSKNQSYSQKVPEGAPLGTSEISRISQRQYPTYLLRSMSLCELTEAGKYSRTNVTRSKETFINIPSSLHEHHSASHFNDEQESGSITSTNCFCLQMLRNEVQTMLIEVRQFHQLLNDYLGPLITLIILTSLVYSILSCFYLFNFTQFSLAMRAVSVSYVGLAFLPLVVLTNIPVMLQTQVMPNMCSTLSC